ncbi:MAG: nucleotidyltransferase domain-containing protein [Nanoarchaeota archaeon]
MLSKNKIIVLNLFRNNPFLESTILQIKHQLKKKSYQRIYEAVNELNQEHILISQKVGTSNLIRLDFSPQTINLLSYLEQEEALKKNIPNINEISEKFKDDILIVTGSYAKGTQKTTSDIDLALITKDKALEKQKQLENLTLSFHPPIHPITFTQKDFVDMLLSKEQNFGKEIFKNNLLFRNAERYFELIKEAIERGFKG